MSIGDARNHHRTSAQEAHEAPHAALAAHPHQQRHRARLNREIRRRMRMAGTFPDGRSALMLVTARLKYVTDSEWGSRRYLDVSPLDE